MEHILNWFLVFGILIASAIMLERTISWLRGSRKKNTLTNSPPVTFGKERDINPN